MGKNKAIHRLTTIDVTFCRKFCIKLIAFTHLNAGNTLQEHLNVDVLDLLTSYSQ